LTLTNVPALNDVATMAKLLAQMGVKVERNGSTLTLQAEAISSALAPMSS